MYDIYKPGYAVRFRQPINKTSNSDFLMHYGVSGQKKGIRRYQNEDGTYTAEGREHYGIGELRQRVGTSVSNIRKSFGNTRQSIQSKVSASASKIRSSVSKPQMSKKQRSEAAIKSVNGKYTPEQLKERRAKAKKIIGISLGVAAAAALGYAAYKGSTNLRDQMRKQILTEQGKGYESINTLHSKYWNAADRAKYSAMTKERAQLLANNTNRRDAIAQKFYEKTGYKLNLPQSRARVIQERRSSQQLGNFIRDAEGRGHTNKQIHDARANLKAAKKKLETYNATERIGTSKQYEAMWRKKHAENVDRYQEILNELLKQRAGGAA